MDLGTVMNAGFGVRRGNEEDPSRNTFRVSVEVHLSDSKLAAHNNPLDVQFAVSFGQELVVTGKN